MREEKEVRLALKEKWLKYQLLEYKVCLFLTEAEEHGYACPFPVQESVDDSTQKSHAETAMPELTELFGYSSGSRENHEKRLMKLTTKKGIGNRLVSWLFFISWDIHNGFMEERKRGLIEFAYRENSTPVLKKENQQWRNK